MGVRKEVAKEYYAWVDMRRRCTNPRHHQYKNYGGRGITVCARWMRSFADFYSDVGPAPTKGHSLGRINNDAGYIPNNTRWETKEEQDNNKRTSAYLTHDGETLTVAQWAKRLKVHPSVIWARLKSGRSVASALDPYVVPKGRKILHNGEHKSEAEWSRVLGIPATTIRARVRQGKPIDKYTKRSKSCQSKTHPS